MAQQTYKIELKVEGVLVDDVDMPGLIALWNTRPEMICDWVKREAEDGEAADLTFDVIQTS